MAIKYDPYSDIEKVYNAKVGWNTATTDEERKRQNEIATAARQSLIDNGWEDVANEISASGANATKARQILEKYAPKEATVSPDSTSLSNSELITTNNNETRNKINQLWGNQTSDRDMMTGKYNKLEDTAYSNPFTTDEAKAILGKYDLAGLYGRDNAVASGSASNGGNIDSYAAANAMRQQASLINQGQMAVLESHNNKINNVKGILSDLGVYLQNQDKGMQATIEQQQTEGQRLFENDLAENTAMAEVTGYTPSAWTIKNDDVYNTYLNSDGTFKKEMENVDIQALINSAKASGDTETANKLAVVRAKKILSNYGEFGKYVKEGDISYMKPQITEARRESEQNDATVRESLKAETAIAQNELDAKERMNAANNSAALEQLVTSASLEAAQNGEIPEDTKKYYANAINGALANKKAVMYDEEGNTVSDKKPFDLANAARKDINGKYYLIENSAGPVARYLYTDYFSGLTEEEKTKNVIAVMSIFGYTEEKVRAFLAKTKEDSTGNRWVIEEK